MATTAGSGREERFDRRDGQRRRGRPKSPSRVIRKVLNKSVTEEWAKYGKHLREFGNEAATAKREECSDADMDMRAFGVVRAILRARENAIVTEVKKRYPAMARDEHQAAIAALWLKEALRRKPRSATSLRREYRARARDLR
jgi:hypothetical protein